METLHNMTLPFIIGILTNAFMETLHYMTLPFSHVMKYNAINSASAYSLGLCSIEVADVFYSRLQLRIQDEGHNYVVICAKNKIAGVTCMTKILISKQNRESTKGYSR